MYLPAKQLLSRNMRLKAGETHLDKLDLKTSTQDSTFGGSDRFTTPFSIHSICRDMCFRPKLMFPRNIRQKAEKNTFRKRTELGFQGIQLWCI